MQARYYDPVIGRFYSNDPVDAVAHLSRQGGIHGFNRYAYANNNPYKYIDPDGRETRLMVEAKYLDADVTNGNMTPQERVDISVAQFEGMVAGAGSAKLVHVGLKLVAKRKAQNIIIKRLTKGMRKQIELHKLRIKKERSLGIKPEMVGKTTKRQQAAQRAGRRAKHRRDIKDWEKQIKAVERKVRSEKK